MAPTRIPSVPSLAHVTLDDLRDLDRVLALAEQAVPRGWLTRCEMDRLNAAAAAVHAQRQADHNPGGLFVAMLQDRRWHLITQAEEDEARGWLRDHDWGSPRRTVPAPSSLAPPPELSNDARVVEVARRVLAQAGWRGDPFLGLKVQDPTWTRERWERALAALENDRLQRRQAQARLTRLQAIVSPDGLWQDLEDNG